MKKNKNKTKITDKKKRNFRPLEELQQQASVYIINNYYNLTKPFI